MESECTFNEYMRLLRVHFYSSKAPTIDQLTDAFQCLDDDGSGAISSSEFRLVLKALGERMSDEEVRCSRELPLHATRVALPWSASWGVARSASRVTFHPWAESD